VVEDFAKSGRDYSRPGHYFHFALEKTQSPQMDCAMFVGVGKVVEIEQGIVNWQTPIRVRLQELDQCPWTIADELNAPSSPASEVSITGEDRKHRLAMLDSGVVERELENALVERGSQVVDDLAQQNRKIEGNRHVEVEIEDVFSETRLYVTANAVGAGLGIDVRNLGVGQNLRLVIRANDFESDGVQCREVWLSDAD
jgi:hypothetical protein